MQKCLYRTVDISGSQSGRYRPLGSGEKL